MKNRLSLDGRTLIGIDNSETGEIGRETVFHLHQTGEQLSGSYSGGSVLEGHLLGTFDGRNWDIRYVQMNRSYETATGHSEGLVNELDDGRVRVRDTWEWESKEGSGESVLEEVRD